MIALALVALLASGDAGPPSVSQSENRPTVPARGPAWHRPELPHAQPAAAPTRIVSLAPVVTETIFRLGRGDRLVGDTRFCDTPEAAKALPKVGGFVDISLERVLALKPDLVVAMPSLGQRDVLDRLREHGVPVRVLFADTLDEVHDLIGDLGAILEATDAASALDEDLSLAAGALRGMHIRARRAAVVVGHDPIVVAGPGTFAADALALAGLKPATAPGAPMWPVWSPESLASSRVELLVVAEGPEAAKQVEALLARALPADKRPVVIASTRPFLMRPGPALVDDLAELRRLLEGAR